MIRQMKNSGIEWIGKIPEEWKRIKFKYLHYGMNTGEAIDKEYWSSNEYDRVFYTAGLLPIRTTYLEFPEWKLTRDNDLLLSRNGTPYVYFPSEYACYTDHIIRAKIKKDVCKKFLQYALQRSISTIVVNQVIIATWSASLWNEQILPFPPLSEQQQIADFLDEKVSQIDSTITKTRESIEEYKKLKQAIITEAVTKGLNSNAKMKNSGIEWIGEIPEDWEVRRTKFIANSMHKGNGITKEQIVQDGDSPCVRYGEIYSKYDNVFYECKTRTNKSFYNVLQYFSFGDILFACTGELPEEIGKNIVYLGNEKCLAGGDIIVLSHSQEPRFLSYVYNSYGQTQKSCGKTKLKVVHISASEIANIFVALPPLSEQQQIADYLDQKCSEIDALITKKEQLITELETYKKSLIYEVVTGKREV